MDIDFKLYFWLCELGVFEDKNPKDERFKTLSKEIAHKFTNGFLVSKILEALKDKVKPDLNHSANFSFVKDTYQDEEIRENWNFLLALLDNGYSIKLDSKTRQLIMSGDKTMVCELYDILYEKYSNLDKDFAARLKQHEARIKDLMILREESAKTNGRKQRRLKSGMTNELSNTLIVKEKSAVNEQVGITELENSEDDGLSNSEDAGRIPRESSSIIMNQSKFTLANMSVMDSSLVMSAGVLKTQCRPF